MLRRFLALSVCWLVWPMISHAGTTAETFGRLPTIEQAVLSPDGSKVAIVTTAFDVRLLAIINLSDSKLLSKARVGDEKLRRIQWADEEHLLLEASDSRMPMELSGERVEWSLLSVYDVKTQKGWVLLNHVNGETPTMNTVYGPVVVQHKDQDTLLYVHGYYITDQTRPGLFRINLNSGTETLIKKSESYVDDWVIDDNGEVVADTGYTERERRWTIDLFPRGHARQTLSGIAPIDAPEILGLSATGDSLIVATTEADGTRWKSLSLNDAAWGADIAPDYSLNDVIFRNGSRHIVGTVYLGDTNHYHFSDPQLQDDWGWVERVFRYQRVELVSASDDFSKLLVLVQGGKFGYAYYLADTKEHLTRNIGNVYDGLDQIAEVRAIQYTAADGLQIPAYLTLPPGRPEKDLPVIVLPHGGPQSRDTQGFDWQAQALAAQGYAVLQPNYRGSQLGLKWVSAGYGEWGRKMQTDLSDGLQFLASKGIVDPKRACIVGASYGGYAAMAGVSLQTGIYRCAVAVSGISSLKSFLYWVQRRDSGEGTSLRYWGRFLDVKDPGDKKLDAISPLAHVDQISVPLLLIHGREDVTVPYDQSEDLVKAMKKAGKPVEFVTLDKEDHYMSRSATRVQMLQATIDFLRRNNPPD